jgi:hypothetical protein
VKRYARANLFAMVALSVGFIACTKEPVPPFDFDREARSMQALTAVDGAQVLRMSDVEPGKVSLRVSWDVEARDLEWVAYCDELRKRLAGRPEFHASESSEGSLGFVRRFPADVHVLRIERVYAESPMRAHVTFSSMAD